MRSIMRSLSKKMPWLVELRNSIRAQLLSGGYAKRFHTIYQKKEWGQNEPTVSGEGSTLERTALLRMQLPELLKEIEVKTMLDLPCGDFFWMRTVQLPIDRYLGADIVPAIIENNNKHYSDPPQRTFCVLDMLKDKIPCADLILCRDCLIHFSNHHIFQALRNMKSSGSSWLLVTNHPEIQKNSNIVTGECHGVNFELAPFHFPTPVKRIVEDKGEKEVHGRELALWRLTDLPV